MSRKIAAVTVLLASFIPALAGAECVDRKLLVAIDDGTGDGEAYVEIDDDRHAGLGRSPAIEVGGTDRMNEGSEKSNTAN